jgi:hypothetical protein
MPPGAAVKVHGSAKDSLVFESNDVRVETEAPPDYYYEKGELRRGGCSKGEAKKSNSEFIRNIALGRGLQYRNLYECPKAN